MDAPDLDPRQHAFDPATRRAEASLRGRVGDGGWTFVDARERWAGPARVTLRTRPEAGASQVTEALPGEALDALWADDTGGWHYVRTRHDGYLGWAPAAGLTERAPTGEALTITALRAHAFAGPRVSQPLRAELCLGSQLERGAGEVVEEGGRRWVPVILPGGEAAWVQEVCFSPLPETDPAALALRFLDAPYVWGGRSAWGLDCSGLTQTVYAAFGRAIPRDADQQQAALAAVDAPRRGDLAFFDGHVGLMLDERRMVHANATHMRVTVETFGEGDYGRRLEAGLLGFGRWPQ